MFDPFPQGDSVKWERLNAIASSESSAQLFLAGVTSEAYYNLDDQDFVARLLNTSVLDGATNSTSESSEGMATPTPNTDTRVSMSTPSPYLVADPTTSSPSSSSPTAVPTLAMDPTTFNPLSPGPTFLPTIAAGDGTSSNTTPMVVVLLVLISLFAMVGPGWLYRRRSRNQEGDATSAAVQNEQGDRDSAEFTFVHANPSLSSGLRSGPSGSLRHDDGLPSLNELPKATLAGTTSIASFGTTPQAEDVGEGKAGDASPQLNDARRQAEGETGSKDNNEDAKRSSSVPSPTIEGSEQSPIEGKQSGYATPAPCENITSPSGTSRKPVRRVGVAQAVIGAAQDLARMSQIPGVAEAAGLVGVLMNLVTDSSDMSRTTDHVVKRCRSVMVLLQRAASVLEEVRDDAGGDACCTRSR